MSDPAGGSCAAGTGHCITCGDEGIAMRLVELRSAAALCVDEEGEVHSVAIDLLDDVSPGTTVLVHAGVAIGVTQ
ncbi:MAG TPA: HypC/HybG/HupF family hydrogenase formation chaperone [Solirubrobacteraceae bacterium]|nr:HypC/HybG/HupF family hydrogenase formation chaperone [Solirubrobacteraceae bacterium]